MVHPNVIGNVVAVRMKQHDTARALPEVLLGSMSVVGDIVVALYPVVMRFVQVYPIVAIVGYL